MHSFSCLFYPQLLLSFLLPFINTTLELTPQTCQIKLLSVSVQIATESNHSIILSVLTSSHHFSKCFLLLLIFFKMKKKKTKERSILKLYVLSAVLLRTKSLESTFRLAFRTAIGVAVVDHLRIYVLFVKWTDDYTYR